MVPECLTQVVVKGYLKLTPPKLPYHDVYIYDVALVSLQRFPAKHAMSTAGFWPSSWENWWWVWAWRIYRFYRAGMRVRSKWLKCSESYNAQNESMSQHLSTNCGSASASIACFPHCIFCCEVAADSSSIGWVPHSRNLKWIIQRREPVGLSYPPLWPCLGWKRGDDHETREADDNRLRRKEPHWQDDSNPCIPPASVSQCPPLVSHRSLPSSSLTLAALSLLTPLLTTRVDRREPDKGRGGWPRERREWGAEVGWTGGERCEQRNTWCEGPAHRPTHLHPLRSFSRHTRSLSSFPSSCSTHIWTNTFLYALCGEMMWNAVHVSIPTRYGSISPFIMQFCTCWRSTVYGKAYWNRRGVHVRAQDKWQRCDTQLTQLSNLVAEPPASGLLCFERFQTATFDG